MSSPLMWTGWMLAFPPWVAAAASGLAVGLFGFIGMRRRMGHGPEGNDLRPGRGHRARPER